MASDLSKLIEESLTSTLSGLLAKEATLQEITKAHTKDVEDTQLLQVQSSFDFDNFSSLFSFMLPARTASLIFNTMMTEPIHELSAIIDDDTEDAIGEFISNTSGGLTTFINSAQFEDVGQTKFNISHKERLDGDKITDLENTYRFQIDLEGNEIIIFITFDSAMLPHIQELTGVPVTHYEIPEEIPEEIPLAATTEDEIPKKDLIAEKHTPQKKSLDTNDPKTKKLKIAIIAVGSLLGLLIVGFLVVYFLGFFDPIAEPPKPEALPATQEEIAPEKNSVKVIQYTTLQKIDFKDSDIDKNRLNTQLAELTKYKVLNKEELEAQELAEKERLFELEREKELLEFSKQNNEEPLFEKHTKDDIREIDKKTKFTDDSIIEETQENENQTLVTEEEKAIEPDQFRYITTNSLRYNLFKSLVLQTQTKLARISICNNEEGKTTIYIGPFETTLLQNNFIEQATINNKTISMNAINITQAEFNLRCNVE